MMMCFQHEQPGPASNMLVMIIKQASNKHKNKLLTSTTLAPSAATPKPGPGHDEPDLVLEVGSSEAAP